MSHGGLLQTGLIVEIPEADPVVAAHRQQLDPGAELGIPAHVTVLFPFAPAAAVDGLLLHRLEGLFGRVAAFSLTLSRTDWFGSDVLWLAPSPVEPFRRVTRLLAAEFPEYPPYDGEFSDVVPHLTIARGAKAAVMREAERQICRQLPISAAVTGVTLMTELESGHWVRHRKFWLYKG